MIICLDTDCRSWFGRLWISCEGNWVPRFHFGEAPVTVAPARLVGAAGVRGALVAAAAGAERAVAAHPEVVVAAPDRPGVRSDGLVLGDMIASARWHEALCLTRLQVEEEVRRGVLVGAGGVGVRVAVAAVPAGRAAGGRAPRPGRLRARKKGTRSC